MSSMLHKQWLINLSDTFLQIDSIDQALIMEVLCQNKDKPEHEQETEEIILPLYQCVLEAWQSSANPIVQTVAEMEALELIAFKNTRRATVTNSPHLVDFLVTLMHSGVIFNKLYVLSRSGRCWKCLIEWLKWWRMSLILLFHSCVCPVMWPLDSMWFSSWDCILKLCCNPTGWQIIWVLLLFWSWTWTVRNALSSLCQWWYPLSFIVLWRLCSQVQLFPSIWDAYPPRTGCWYDGSSWVYCQVGKGNRVVNGVLANGLQKILNKPNE